MSHISNPPTTSPRPSSNIANWWHNQFLQSTICHWLMRKWEILQLSYRTGLTGCAFRISGWPNMVLTVIIHAVHYCHELLEPCHWFLFISLGQEVATESWNHSLWKKLVVFSKNRYGTRSKKEHFMYLNHKYYNFLESDRSIHPPIRTLIGHLQSEIVILND